MDFTKEQLSDVFVKHIERERGLQESMEPMIESMMIAERRDFLDTHPGNKGNGFRQGKSYGHGRVLEFRTLQTIIQLYRVILCFAEKEGFEPTFVMT
jgi:putative transposase